MEGKGNHEAFARAIAAKARVCVHGTASVVEELAKFEGSPGEDHTPEKKKYFLQFMTSVRKDSGAKGKNLSEAVIDKILFGRKGAN